MTNQIFYEELRATIRDAIASYLDTYTDEELRELATESLNLPPRPTLAEMPPEERAECKWMQADVPEVSPDQTCIITRISPGGATVLDRDGVAYRWFALDSVTPRPDLPRMEWPGNKKPDPALPGGWRVADHKNNGRVIVTTPNNDGRVYYVLPSDFDGLGFDWFFCHTDELTYLDGDQ